jgi:hypothetical protein
LSESTPILILNSTPLRLSPRERVVNLGAVIVPFLGLAAAVVFLRGPGFSWVAMHRLRHQHSDTPGTDCAGGSWT